MMHRTHRVYHIIIMTLKKEIGAGTSKKENKDGVANSWPAGVINMEVPDIDSWTSEQRKKFATNFAKLSMQYMSSTLYRNKKGVCPEKGVTTGQILWDATSGVMRFNPDYEIGSVNEKSPEQVAKLMKLVDAKVQAFELLKGRKIADSELEMLKFHYGIV